jgi:uncharacterized protein (TIGR03437 family)
MLNTLSVSKRILTGLALLPFALGIAFAQVPAIDPGGTVNAASNAKLQPVAAGSLVSIYGSNFAAGLALASSVPLSTTLGNTSVTINGIPAPLDFVSPGQINAQVPFELLGINGAVNVVVNNNNVSSVPDPVILNPTAPAVFGANTTPNNYAIAFFGVDSDPRFLKYAWPPNTLAGATTFLAKPGDILTVYATGLGAVNPPEQSGHDSQDALRQTVANTTVLIGNVNAQVFFAGLNPFFPGVYQLNIGVPQVPPGNAVPIQIQIGGVTSPSNIFIGVGAP